jgi:hypothetical protein
MNAVQIEITALRYVLDPYNGDQCYIVIGKHPQ